MLDGKFLYANLERVESGLVSNYGKFAIIERWAANPLPYHLGHAGRVTLPLRQPWRGIAPPYDRFTVLWLSFLSFAVSTIHNSYVLAWTRFWWAKWASFVMTSQPLTSAVAAMTASGSFKPPSIRMATAS